MPSDPSKLSQDEVPFVGTKENVADFLTKPMSNATEFSKFRHLVMNIRD